MDQEPKPKPAETVNSPNQTSEQGKLRHTIIQSARNFFSRAGQAKAENDVKTKKVHSSMPTYELPNPLTQSAPEKNEILSTDFESQFSHRQSLKTPEGTLTYFDIKPEIEAQDNTPILVIPGWAITLETEKPLLQALHDSGKPTIAVEVPRFGGKAESQDGIPAEVVRQAEMIAKLISQQPEGQRIDIVAQSMGVMAVLAAAKIEPGILKKVRNFVPVSAAGVSGNDNIVKLASRYLAQHVPQDTAYLLRGKWNIAVMSAEAGKYMRNPVRTLKEAVAISQSEDYDAFQILRDNGVRVALMQGQSDKLTPADKLWDRMGEGRSPLDQFARVEKTKEGEDPKTAFEQRGATPSGFKYTGPVSSEHPPFDALTMVTGGHDNRIYADSEKFAAQILKRIDFLNQPTPTAEQVVKNIKRPRKQSPEPGKASAETQQEKSKLQKFLLGVKKSLKEYYATWEPDVVSETTWKEKLSKIKVFGQPLQDVLIGGATSSAVKLVARSGLAFAGVSGLPAFAAIGATGGSATGGAREYLRQRREINQKDSEQLAQIRRGLKRELHRLKAADKKRVGKAALRGAAYGAVGGVIGAEIVDYISQSDFIQEKAGKAASYIRENAPSAGGFIKDSAVQGTGLVKDKAGPKLEALGNWVKPVTKPIQEKAGPKIEAIGDTVGPIARDIQQRSSRAYEAFTEKPVPVAGVKIEAPGTTPEIKTPHVATPESITAPVLPKLPHGLESVKLESGSSPWAKVHGYLTENLGREPTNQEIQTAVGRVLVENNITDATRIPAGAELKFSGVNRYVEDLLSGKPLLSPDIAGMPEVVSLPEGSNPWNEVSKYLEDGLGRPATDNEVLEVVKAVARTSDIKVPDWGIDGANLDTQLQPGYKLNFNNDVKSAIQKISDKPQIDITPNNTPKVPAVGSQTVTPPRPTVTEITQSQPVPTPVETPPPTPKGTATPASTPTPEAAANQSGIPYELKTFYLPPENRSAEGIKNFVQNYLMFNLGRQVTPEEISAGIEKVTLGNVISDASTATTKDFELNLAGLNQYIKQLSSK